MTGIVIWAVNIAENTENQMNVLFFRLNFASRSTS